MVEEKIEIKTFRYAAGIAEISSVDPIPINTLKVLDDKRGNKWLVKIVDHVSEDVRENPLRALMAQFFGEDAKFDVSKFLETNPFFEYYTTNLANVSCQINTGGFVKKKVPPTPGSVLKDLDDSVRSFFANDLPIAWVKDTDILTGLSKMYFNKPIGIFGDSGSGKSNLAANLMTEADYIKHLVNTIVVDSQFELALKLARYVELNNISNVKILSVGGKLPKSLNLKVNPNEFFPDDWNNIFYFSQSQIALLRKIYKQRKEHNDWLTYFLEEYEPTSGETKSYDAITRRLVSLVDDPLFDKEAEMHSLFKLLMGVVDNKYSLILDVSEIKEEELEKLICSYIAKVINNKRAEKRESKEYTDQDDFIKKTKPIWLVIEEAHRLLSAENPNKFFKILVKEERKNNTGLVIIEQNPGALEKDFLRFMSTKLIMSLGVREDVRQIEETTTYISSREEIMNQDKGEAQLIIQGEGGLPFAVPIYTWKYETKYLLKECESCKKKFPISELKNDKCSKCLDKDMDVFM